MPFNKNMFETFFTDTQNGQKLCEAISANNNYQERIREGSATNPLTPNPQSREEFVVEWVFQLFRKQRETYNWERRKLAAQELAASQTNDELEGLGD